MEACCCAYMLHLESRLLHSAVIVNRVGKTRSRKGIGPRFKNGHEQRGHQSPSHTWNIEHFTQCQFPWESVRNPLDFAGCPMRCIQTLKVALAPQYQTMRAVDKAAVDDELWKRVDLKAKYCVKQISLKRDYTLSFIFFYLLKIQR